MKISFPPLDTSLVVTENSVITTRTRQYQDTCLKVLCTPLPNDFKTKDDCSRLAIPKGVKFILKNFYPYRSMFRVLFETNQHGKKPKGRRQLYLCCTSLEDLEFAEASTQL